MPSTRLLAGVAIALLAAAAVVPALVPVAAGSSPPRAVCGICDGEFERIAADAGYPLDVEHAGVTVAVGANGTGRWTIRLETTDGAAAVAADPSGFAALLDEHYAGYRTLVDDPRDLRVAVDGSTVVVRFSVSGMAHRTAGVFLVDYFHGGAADVSYRMAADRLTVRGPPGTTLANDPPGAVAENGTAVWTGGGRDGDAGFTGGTYVVFGSGAGVVSWVAGQAAIATDVGPLVLSQTAIVSVVPVAVLLAALGAVVGICRSLHDWIPRPGPVGAVVAAAGGAMVATGLAGVSVLGVDNGTFLLGAGTGYALVGLVGAWVSRTGRAVRLRPVALLAVAGTAPLVAVSFGTGSGLRPIPLAVVVQTALFPVVGYLAARSDRPVFPVAVVLALVTVLGVLPGVPYGGFGPPFVAILVTLFTVVGVVAGVPLATLGAALGATGRAGTTP